MPRMNPGAKTGSARQNPWAKTGKLRTAKACGSGTRCWCQADGGQVDPTGFGQTFNPSATVARRIRRREEHDISRKTTAQGMPECSDCTCMLVCVFFAHFCTRDRGCSKHPAFPAPSFLWADFFTARAHRAAGLRSRTCGRSHVIARSDSDEAIHPSACAARWIASLRSQ